MPQPIELATALQRAEIAEHAVCLDIGRAEAVLGSLGDTAISGLEVEGMQNTRHDWHQREVFVDAHAKLIMRYPEFQGTVNNLLDSIAHLEVPRKHPDYLGAGRRSRAYQISHNGQEYAVRVLKVNQADCRAPRFIAEYVASLVRGQGLQGLEQITAVSYEDGVTVSEIAPGTRLDELKGEEYLAITKEHLSQALVVLAKGIERGISFDIVPSNILFSVKQGLTFIDYCSSNVAARDGMGANYHDNINHLVESIEFQKRRCGTPEARPIMDHLCHLASHLTSVASTA